MSLQVIAIDGAAASGKSSTGKAVAQSLGWAHLDTGALYRALALVALEAGDSAPKPLGGKDILDLAVRRDLRLVPIACGIDREIQVALEGRLLDREIRTPEVTAKVSEVAAIPEVRFWANCKFRAAVVEGLPTVVDGRDIGSVVFPDAPLKIFLTAAAETRALRRLLQEATRSPSPQQVTAEASKLAARDTADATRETAPMRQADDAVLLDTTTLGFEEQVAAIVRMARAKDL